MSEFFELKAQLTRLEGELDAIKDSIEISNVRLEKELQITEYYQTGFFISIGILLIWIVVFFVKKNKI